jgi:CheY-like chemotaxis protein
MPKYRQFPLRYEPVILLRRFAHVSMRLRNIETSKLAEMSQTPANANRLRILVADDNLDSADSLAIMLGMYGHEVRTANDGAAALSAAESFHPEVILLDIGMPKLSGVEACKLIRQQEWSRSALILALTGWDDAEDRQRSRDAGFDHHLAKPVEFDTLQKMLDEAIEKRARQ